MLPFFIELFRYNHHSNLSVLEILSAEKNVVSDKSIKLFSHILNAHHIWNHRINGMKPSFAVWDVHPVNEFAKINQSNFLLSVQILENHELGSEISYTNSKGQTFVNSKKDILFHIINHSTYHRAQIATECKQAGIDPASTDYIFYKR